MSDATSNIVKINIEDEMKTAYIDYSMSVIISRALPDVRDGLKPVHRRVLFGINELGITANKAHKKSARIVGEVLGKYHPHGDTSVYNAMVRMAQGWSLRYPLIDGQGNFGSVDGDSPAAMRYTEARLKKIAESILSDLDKDTVDFQLNFDDTLEEPSVLPTRIPTLLINGASGIAVGMATNMPPHNLSSVIDATIAYIYNNDVDIEELIKIVIAPDFPTGGTIYGYQGVQESFRTGRGRIVLRSKTNIETTSTNREKIIVTEIPYMVNKAELIIKIASLINEKKIDGISNINDESDRNGMRITIDLKRDAIANVVLNKLYKYTQLQNVFSVNNIALVKGRPQLLNLKSLISNFIEHRHEVIIRRTRYELKKAEEKAHILEGLLIAIDNLDKVISLIRSSQTPEIARNNLISKFNLSEIQAKAILDMRLQKLTGLEREKLQKDYKELQELIVHLNKILGNLQIRMDIIRDELLEMKDKYGDERKTDIIYSSEEFNPEDFYADEDMIITISHLGYIKRTALNEFKTQNRGGVGSKGSVTRDEDFIEHIYPASMHNMMLLFTKKGKCFWLKVYDIPEGSKNSKGRAIQNILNIDPSDKVKAYIRVKQLKNKEFIESHYITLCTKKGIIKKTLLESFSRPRQNGVNAINIREDDQLLEARLTDGHNEIIIAIKSGRAIRFNENRVRAMGRTATGVRGIRFATEIDEVVGMICIPDSKYDVLVVSEKGYGKRSNLEDYRTTNRGGKGIKTMNITEKTGKLIGIKNVTDDNDLMIINKSGITIRLAVARMRRIGRAAQGVKLIDLTKKKDQISSVAKVDSDKLDNTENSHIEETNNDNNQNTIDTNNDINDLKNLDNKQNIDDQEKDE